MTILPVFKDYHNEVICEDQKRRKYQLENMIHDGLAWYENQGEHDINFEDVIHWMDTGAVANALEECTADEIADFLKVLGAIIREDYDS